MKHIINTLKTLTTKQTHHTHTHYHRHHTPNNNITDTQQQEIIKSNLRTF